MTMSPGRMARGRGPGGAANARSQRIRVQSHSPIGATESEPELYRDALGNGARFRLPLTRWFAGVTGKSVNRKLGRRFAQLPRYSTSERPDSLASFVTWIGPSALLAAFTAVERVGIAPHQILLTAAPPLKIATIAHTKSRKHWPFQARRHRRPGTSPTTCQR
jgi:hypothetical protein